MGLRPETSHGRWLLLERIYCGPCVYGRTRDGPYLARVPHELDVAIHEEHVRAPGDMGEITGSFGDAVKHDRDVRLGAARGGGEAADRRIARAKAAASGRGDAPAQERPT